MRRHLVNKKPASNGSLPQRAAAMANVRRSPSPSQSNSDQMEVDDASLQAAITLFSNTVNGINKNKKGKPSLAQAKLMAKSVRFSDKNQKDEISSGASASEPLAKEQEQVTTFSKMLDKIQTGVHLSLPELQAVTSLLQSPLMSVVPQIDEFGHSQCQQASDFVSFAYFVTLNAHSAFQHSQNVSELNSLTKQTASLLDVVKALLDYYSSVLEPKPEESPVGETKNTPKPLSVRLGFLARVLSTFTSPMTHDAEESKKPAGTCQLSDQVKNYTESPCHVVEQVITDVAALVSNQKVEEYLTEQLKSQDAEEVAVDQIMLEDKDEQKKPSPTEPANFDDLDSVLNHESKEFTELVTTMNSILSINKTDKSQNQQAEPAQQETQIVTSEKDQTLNQEFLNKSVTGAIESVERYIRAILAPFNGINATATVAQLHLFTSLQGVGNVGPLLRVLENTNATKHNELSTFVKTTLKSQIDVNFTALEQSNESFAQTDNKKQNVQTEREIALVRLAGLAIISESIKDGQDHLLQKVSDCSLFTQIEQWVENCTSVRQDNLIKSICFAIQPIQRLISSLSGSTDGHILNLTVSMNCLVQKLKETKQNKAEPTKNMTTRSASLKSTEQVRKPPVAKSRDDFRKFLKAKRQVASGTLAAQELIVVSSSKENSESKELVADDVDMKIEQISEEDEEEKKEFEPEEEKKEANSSDAEKEDGAPHNEFEQIDTSYMSFEEPLVEQLKVVSAPDFDKIRQASQILLVYVTKQVTHGPTIDSSMLSSDTLNKLLSLTQKAEQSKLPVFEGILQLFCRSSLKFTAETQKMVETVLGQIDLEVYANSRTITSFACKQILKQPFSAESIKQLVNCLLKYVFEKGFLKKQTSNGALYQGMTLNVYMLFMTCVCVPGTSKWRKDVLENVLIAKFKSALKSEAAKKSTILTYLQQMWHLMALLMLDESAQKLQIKAVYAFLAKSEPSATLEKLLCNPFNWIVGQESGQVLVNMSATELVEFVDDIYSIRNIFNLSEISESLEIPCAIIGAQLAILGQYAIQSAQSSTSESLVLLQNVLKMHDLLTTSESITDDQLKQRISQTESELQDSLKAALQVILADKSYSEQELNLLRLCLQSDASKPLLNLTTIKDSFLAKAFKKVLVRDNLPFPISHIGSDKAKGPIDSSHVCQHLFSQIRTLSQTGIPDIPKDSLYLIQSYHSKQTLQCAQVKLLSHKSAIPDSIEEVRANAITHYMIILGQSVDLIEQLVDGAEDASSKIQEIKTMILDQVTVAEYFAQHHLQQHLSKLLSQQDPDSSNDALEKLGTILRTVFRKELIQTVKTSKKVQNHSGIALSFEFGQGRKLTQRTLDDMDKKHQVDEESQEETNVVLNKILTAFTSAINQETLNNGPIVDRLWAVLSTLSNELAIYLGKALEQQSWTQDISSFLSSCFKSCSMQEALSEFVYEAIETTCGIQTSVQGFLSTAFVLNSMNLANVIQNLSTGSNPQAEQRFVQFIKEVLMQQVFENEDARLLVLDTLCILCQNLKEDSHVQSGESSLMAGSASESVSEQMIIKGKTEQLTQDGLIIESRKQYLEYKEQVECYRLKEEKEAEEDMRDREINSAFNAQGHKKNHKGESKKKKAPLLEGYRQDVFDNVDGYSKYMFNPQDKCTYLKTGKQYEEQHWYQCYTCGLTGNTGVCATCVRTCHKGHHIVYCKKSTFYCDCAQDGGSCNYSEQINKQQESSRSGMGGLFGMPPPPNNAFQAPPGGRAFGIESFAAAENNPLGSSAIRAPDFFERVGGFGNERSDSPGMEVGGLFDRPMSRARPQSRLSRVLESQSIFGAPAQSSIARPELHEPYMPSFAAFGSRPPRDLDARPLGGPSGGLFGQASSSILGSVLGSQPHSSVQRPGAGASARPAEREKPGAPGSSSFAHFMRRFDRIVNDESDNSNADGDNHQEALEQARDNEISRIIERSLSRGQGALFSDAMMLGSGANRIGGASGPDRPIFEVPASDSGGDELEALDDSNLAAIQQDMIEAGYSAGEIRASLQNRIDRQNKSIGDNEESSSSSSQIQSLHGISSSKEQPDFEMSQVSSLSQDSWGGISDAESLHTIQFRQKLGYSAVEAQNKRFSALKTVLSDQQELVEGILTQVYSQLDSFRAGEGEQFDEPMDLGSALLLRQQSSLMQSSILVNPAKPRAIEFTNEFVQQKQNQKEGTFKVAIQDRTVKSYVQKKMLRRNCVSSTDQGLVCIVQDDAVLFYGANSLLDPSMTQGASEKNQLYQAHPKKGSSSQTVNAVDTFKPSFVPVSAAFNPAFQSYCAVWGKNDLSVLTVCPKDGKVKSDLTVNLMLAAFGEHLTILDVEWIPGARTILGVGTKTFVRIYDLAKDNFSPLYNVQLTSGQISDFTFTKPLNGNFAESGRIQTRILVASDSDCTKDCKPNCKTGQLFSHELNLSNEDKEQVGISAQMQVDEQQNNEIFLTNRVEIQLAKVENDKRYTVEKETGCVPKISSISYLPSNSMVAVTFKSGQTVIGHLDLRSFALNNCITIPQISGLKKPSAQLLSQNGERFSKFRELGYLNNADSKSQHMFLVANYSKKGLAVPCILKLSQDKITINVVKGKTVNLQNKLTPVHGYGLIMPSFKKQWRKAPRIMTVDELGQAVIYKVDQTAASESEERKDQKYLQELNQQRKITKTDLPKKVIMPANFFEKQQNIWHDQALYKQMVISGSFASQLKQKVHRLFDAKAQPEGFSSERESETKLNLSLNTKKSNHLINGVRVLISASSRNEKIKFQLFDREPVTVPQGSNQYWFDLALSDVEAIYGSQNQVEMIFTTTNAKSCPVRLFKVEVFVASISDFQLAEKMSKHLKELYNQIKAKQTHSPSATSSSSIKKELLQSNHLPYVTWSEKYMASKSSELSKSQQLETKLSILQQFLLSNMPVDKTQAPVPELISTLKTLQTKLTDAYKLIIEKEVSEGEAVTDVATKSGQDVKDTSHSDSEEQLHASIKRTLKIVLSMLSRDSILGEPLNFKTVKDTLVFEAICKLYSSPDQEIDSDMKSIEQVRSHLKFLGSIRQKRSPQYFKLIEKDTNLVSRITNAYMQASQSDKHSGHSADILKETNDLVNLILADYQLHVNQKPSIKDKLNGGDLKTTIAEIFEDVSLSDRLEPLTRLLMTKNDRVAKQVIKSVQRCLFQYQTMMARTFKSSQIVRFKYYNQVTSKTEETSVIMVDVIPHLLHQLLMTTIPKYREKAQLGFKVALGTIHSYVQNSTRMGLPIEFLFPAIKLFIKRVLCDTQVSECTYQFAYACLTLTNTLLVSVDQMSALSNKSIFPSLPTPSQQAQISAAGFAGFGAPSKDHQPIQQERKDTSSQSQISPLSSQHRFDLIKYLSDGEEGKELTEKLLNWVSSALEQLNAAYQAGRCSLRVQIENQVKVGAQDYLGDGQLGQGVNLLRPILSQQASWRWTPLLPDSEQLFELLDRKIPAQILVLNQILLVNLPHEESQPSYKKLLRAISQLSHTLPSSQIYSFLGQRTLMALSPSQAMTFKNQTLLREFMSDLKQICTTQLKIDLTSQADQISQNQLKEMSYNMQFQFQKMLQNGTKPALETPKDWRELIDQTGSRNEIVQLLIKLIDYVSSKSAFLCLTLAIITLEKTDVDRQQSVARAAIAFYQQNADGSSLFNYFVALLSKESKENKDKESTINTDQKQLIKIDIKKLVEVYLLGKSNRMIRISTALLIKCLYDSSSIEFKELLPVFVSQFETLSAAGVNSAEFISIFGYMLSKEMAKPQGSSGITKEQASQIVSFISSQIKTCNRQLTSHPNLDLYATIGKVCNQGSRSTRSMPMAPPPGMMQSAPNMSISEIEGNHPVMLGENRGFDPRLSSAGQPPSQLLMGLQQAKDAQASSAQSQYILELDPCSKCYQMIETPFRQASLKDIQSESKFTDNTSIYRLKNAYELKSFEFHVQEAKGYKTITKISLYVNSVQDVDIAEMKNNWGIWQKVCDLQVDITSSNKFGTTLPLPVTATNILVEYHSTNLSKPVEFNSRKSGGAAKYYGAGQLGQDPTRNIAKNDTSAEQVEGLDPVLQLLPKEVTNKLSMASIAASSSQAGDGMQQNISMTCPRCGNHVNNSHGNCNHCGENAMQCPACRNINYEKIDPYQCKECGISRYCKGDLTLNLKEGIAIQTIDSEDMKKTAEEQVEKNLQQAQASYQSLMKQRQLIQSLACQINEGNPSASPKYLQTVFTGECTTQYSAMMKSLSAIRLLRIEINKFQKTAESSAVGTSCVSQDFIIGQMASGEKIEQSCFGCVQEYLQALLNFIMLTARFSNQIREEFAKKEQAKQLYQESLRMFSQSIQKPARFAICALVWHSEEEQTKLLQQVESDLHNRLVQVPAHLLFQNLHQEAQLVIDLFSIGQNELKKKSAAPQKAIASLWRVLFQSLNDAKDSSAVAEAVTAPILAKIDSTIAQELRESQRHMLEEQKKQEMQVDEQQKQLEQSSAILIKTEGKPGFFNPVDNSVKGESAMLQLLSEYLLSEDQGKFEFVKGEWSTCSTSGQWLVQSLLLKSSQQARQNALAIFKRLLNEKDLRSKITEVFIQCLDQSLQNPPLSSEEYFNLLSNLLTQQDKTDEEVPKELRLGGPSNPFAKPPEVEKPKKKSAQPPAEVSEDTKRHFRQVFDRIDGELVKLFDLEQAKKKLGQDGFMPQLSAGQSLCRLVKIVALMMNDQPALTQIVQGQVRVVLKTLLKLKKLTLVKNRQIKNCEEQINGIFKKLHSENDSDKSNFIKECLCLIESGDCDLQEARYLFEDICKMIVPAKPDLEYHLHLQKARSNEEFIPGKMSKNPYSSKSFGGKTMADVRLKICRDCDIGEPEMLELLVAGKIVTMNLPITAVYEQVWWPAQYKSKHPDSYEVPPIEQGMKEDPNLINSMVVIFRLAGMDGEATEDRVESLQTDQEPSSEKELEKKYGLASVVGDAIGANGTSGVSVLLNTLSAIGHVQENKDLASWLVQLMNISIKLKKNRLEFLRHPKAVAIIAKKLFQSVGMHSKFDGKNEQSLFDLILNILEVLINEQINAVQSAEVESAASMQVDAGASQQANARASAEDSEAVTHVQIFLSLISDACKEMIDQMKPLDQAPNKIKSVSKVLPQLISQTDHEALVILVSLVQEHLTIEKVHLTLLPSQNASISPDSFSSKFYIERIIDIIESIPVHKNFIKDSLSSTAQFNDLLKFMMTESAQFKEPTVDRTQDLTQNVLMLRIVKAMIKNHSASQKMLQNYGLVEKLYSLSHQKFKPMQLVLLAEDCIKLLTNELASSEVRTGLQTIIDKKNKEQALRAKKAKMAAKMRLQKKGNVNKFMQMMESVEEEKGPKCVSCEDGYKAKPGEIMGVYVFAKKYAFKEWTGPGSGLNHQSYGYTTVTHNNYIHYQCHQEAARVDRERQQPIREWDGAKTRNHMTLCNNLFPVFGGSIQQSAYHGVTDKYFAMLQKQAGGADSNRVKVLSHDLKSLLKRFARNESFSLDSKGGGPEHNMQFVPFITSMILNMLQNGPNAQQHVLSQDSSQGLTYVQEKRLAEFLELSTIQRQSFLARLAEEEGEEEKRSESEEEDKRMEEEDGEEESHESQSDDLSSSIMRPASMQRPTDKLPEEDARVDQVFFFMSQALIFGRMANWEKIKLNLITCALCVVAATRNQPQANNQRLRMMDEAEEDHSHLQGRARARSLSNQSFGLMENLPEILGRLKPFFIMLGLVDTIKKTWDGRVADESEMQISTYHEQLVRDYLTKDNLVKVTEDSDLFIKTYDEKLLKVESVEGYLNVLKLTDKVKAEFMTVEKFVSSHF